MAAKMAHSRLQKSSKFYSSVCYFYIRSSYRAHNLDEVRNFPVDASVFSAAGAATRRYLFEVPHPLRHTPNHDGDGFYSGQDTARFHVGIVAGGASSNQFPHAVRSLNTASHDVDQFAVSDPRVSDHNYQHIPTPAGVHKLDARPISNTNVSSTSFSRASRASHDVNSLCAPVAAWRKPSPRGSHSRSAQSAVSCMLAPHDLPHPSSSSSRGLRCSENRLDAVRNFNDDARAFSAVVAATKGQGPIRGKYSAAALFNLPSVANRPIHKPKNKPRSRSVARRPFVGQPSFHTEILNNVAFQRDGRVVDPMSFISAADFNETVSANQHLHIRHFATASNSNLPRQNLGDVELARKLSDTPSVPVDIAVSHGLSPSAVMASPPPRPIVFIRADLDEHP